MKEISSVILAAGKGKRMYSDIPKVLHEISGKPMISYILNNLKDCGINEITVVVGYKGELVEEYLKNFNDINIIFQKEQLGTAHAVNCTRNYFNDKKDTTLLIINGDTPLLRKNTILQLVNFHMVNPDMITLVTSEIRDPSGYGRIMREDISGEFIYEIVEEKDADSLQKKIKEINCGIYLLKSSILFDLISEISNKNTQREFYLTDIVKIARKKGIKTRAFMLSDYREGLGINSKDELSMAEEVMQEFLKKEWMQKGVLFIMPKTIYIESDVILSKDVIIEPNCIIKGKTFIGEKCHIGGFSYIENSKINKDVRLEPFSKIINNNIDNHQ